MPRQTVAQSYLAQRVTWGGIETTRGEVYAELYRMAPSRACAEMAIAGFERGRELRERQTQQEIAK